MKIRCPHCGSTADSHSSYAFSAMRHEFTFRCNNSRCKQTFTGKIDLAFGLPNGMRPSDQVLDAPSTHEHLRDQNTILADY